MTPVVRVDERTARVWSGDNVRLDRALAELGLARSRSHAAELIARGRVACDGRAAVKAGSRVVAGAVLEVSAGEHYVSRAAHKLIAGLDTFGGAASGGALFGGGAFDLDPTGLLALDLGASTGGFTQVLLERGAREVIALDVGHDQLAAALRDDERVRVVEGCNARELDAARLAEVSGTDEAPGLVVGDLSFISLTLVLPAIARVAPAARLLLLIKPQFEVGRGGLSDGIVDDPRRAVDAVIRVLACAAEHGYACAGLAPSPITGEHGNREVLAYFTPSTGEAAVDPTEWEQHVRVLCERALLGGGS